MSALVVTPRDPLRNFRFTLRVGASMQAVAGVQRVSGLTATVSPLEVWEGGNNLHRYANPDKITWDPVTFDQGLALDSTLEDWAETVRYFVMTGTQQNGQSVKRDVTIDARGWNGADAPVVRSYALKNAWVSKYVALARMDALASEVALVSVELVHEGWTVTTP
jgi:phage tail-like protein